MNVAGTLVTIVVISSWIPLLPSPSSGQSVEEDRLAIRDRVGVKDASVETSDALMGLVDRVQLSDQTSEDQVRSALLTAAMLFSLLEKVDSSESSEESARDLYRKAVRVLAGARRAAFQSALRAAPTARATSTDSMTEQMTQQIETIEANLGRLDRYFSGGESQLAIPSR